MATEQESIFFNTLDRDQDGKVSINAFFKSCLVQSSHQKQR